VRGAHGLPQFPGFLEARHSEKRSDEAIHWIATARSAHLANDKHLEIKGRWYKF